LHDCSDVRLFVIVFLRPANMSQFSLAFHSCHVSHMTSHDVTLTD